MEAKMLLKEADIFPTAKVLKEALGEDTSNVLNTFLEVITNHVYGLTFEWRYYNDGKAWLGKAVSKKKTIFWLSVWEGFFKTSFYFTEKNLEAIAALPISEQIKEDFSTAKMIGKLIPMIIDIKSDNELADLLTVVNYKKSLK